MAVRRTTSIISTGCNPYDNIPMDPRECPICHDRNKCDTRVIRMGTCDLSGEWEVGDGCDYYGDIYGADSGSGDV